MTNDTPHPSICFVALKAYNVLSGDRGGEHIGGAEVQQSLIARELAQRQYPVSFVTLDHGQPDGQCLDGIRCFPAYRPDAGWPVARFVHPRITKVWNAMARADADVYYQRTSDPLTGVVAAFCRRRQRRFVFALGHDGDCDPQLPFCTGLRERIPYRWGLKAAHLVIAQTLAQQQRLRRHFQVDSVVVPSCARSSPAHNEPVERKPPRLIWVGRFAPEKRLELLLDVAQQCPRIAFDVLGDGPDTPAVARLQEHAARLENVHLHGYVPYATVGTHYHRATALINTSAAEGFPNTFLEAWSRSIPVVTWFDPDGVVAQHRLGIVARSPDALSQAARSICDDQALHQELSANARDYYQAHHTVEVAVACYQRLFQNLVTGRPQSRPQTRSTTIHSETV